MSTDNMLAKNTLIPIVTLHDKADAVPLARALVAGGIHALEIRLTTTIALAAMSDIVDQVEHIVVGAGMVTSVEQLEQARDAGVGYGASPGYLQTLATGAEKLNLPYLPGVQTMSDILAAYQAGFTTLKLFPGMVAGGVNFLHEVIKIFPEIRFCVVGGLRNSNISEFLALENVSSVGGTWLTPQTIIAEKNWDAIAELAEQTCQIVAAQ